MKRFISSAALVAIALLTACTSSGTAYNPPFGGAPLPWTQPVSVKPDALSFTALGSGAAQSVAVFQSRLTRSYTETDNCSGVATISQQGSVSHGTATYEVTPTGAGGCTATFKGVGSNTGTLTISSAPYGSVMPNPSSFSFLGTGASYEQPLTVTQSGYAGTYGESDDCSGIATISESSNGGGTAVYDVTPVAVGSCQITITGGNGKQAFVGVTVTTTSFGIK